MGNPRDDLKYEPICALGAGAFGSVAQCRRVGLEGGPDIVAVKATRKEDGAWGLKLGLHEAKILKACDHPTIVKMLDAFRSQSGRAYLVMEYVEFCASSLLRTFPYGLPLAQLKLTAWQLCVALRYLHGRGILHRDIKPANILISRDGSTKLCDFGMARVLGSGSPNSPPDGALTGYVVTRYYRPPEILLGLSYGPSADVFSLGCTIAELATGAALFAGSSSLDQIHRLARCLGPLPPHMAAAAITAAARKQQVHHLHEHPAAGGAQGPAAPLPAPAAAAPAAGGTAGVDSWASAAASPLEPVRGRGLRERLLSLGGVQPEPGLVQFIQSCLELDPAKRLTPHQLLQLPYFDDVGLLVSGTPLQGLYVRECSQVGEPAPAEAAPAAVFAAPAPPVRQSRVLSIAAMLHPDGAAAPVAPVALQLRQRPAIPRLDGSDAAPPQMLGAGARRVVDVEGGQGGCRTAQASAPAGRVAAGGSAGGAAAAAGASLVDSKPRRKAASDGGASSVAALMPGEVTGVQAAGAGMRGSDCPASAGAAAWASMAAPMAPPRLSGRPPCSAPGCLASVQEREHGKQCVVLDVASLLQVPTTELAGHVANVARLCATVRAAVSASGAATAASAAPPTAAVPASPPPSANTAGREDAGRVAGGLPREGVAQRRSEAATKLVLQSGWSGAERRRRPAAAAAAAAGVSQPGARCRVTDSAVAAAATRCRGGNRSASNGQLVPTECAGGDASCRARGDKCGGGRLAAGEPVPSVERAEREATASVERAEGEPNPSVERAEGKPTPSVVRSEEAMAGETTAPAAGGFPHPAATGSHRSSDEDGSEPWHAEEESISRLQGGQVREVRAGGALTCGPSQRPAGTEGCAGQSPKRPGPAPATGPEPARAPGGQPTAVPDPADAASVWAGQSLAFARASVATTVGNCDLCGSLSFSGRARAGLLLSAGMAAAAKPGGGPTWSAGGRAARGNADASLLSSTLDCSLVRTATGGGMGAGTGCRYSLISSASGLGPAQSSKVLDPVCGPGGVPSVGAVGGVPGMQGGGRATGRKGGVPARRGGLAAAARALFVCWRPPAAAAD